MRDLTKKLFFLAAGMFAMGCSTYIVAGLLPGISASLGVSIAAAGQGLSAFGAAYVLCAPTFAVLLARKSARFNLLLALLIFCLGNTLTLFSTHLFSYLAGRAITGMGAGLYSPIVVAAAVQLIPAAARGRALSFLWGANSAGTVIGVPVGLWLAGRMGWRFALALIVAFAMLAFLGIARQRLELPVVVPPSLAKRFRLLFDRRVLSVVGVTAFTALGSLGLYAYVAPMHAGAATSLPMAIFIWSLGGLVGSSAIGYVVDHVARPGYVMVGLLTVLLIAIFSLPFLRSLPVVGLFPFFLWGAMGWSTVTPQQHVLMSLQPEQGATLAALNASAISLGAMAGSMVGGYLLSRNFSASHLPFAAALVLICALAWQMFSLRGNSGESVR